MASRLRTSLARTLTPESEPVSYPGALLSTAAPTVRSLSRSPRPASVSSTTNRRKAVLRGLLRNDGHCRIAMSSNSTAVAKS